MEVGKSDGLTHYWYLRYQLDGRYLDSLPVPLHPTTRSSWASAAVAPGTGRILRGVNVVPFHPIPQWTVTARGTILSTAADTPVLLETDVRETAVKRIELAWLAMVIPPAERAESLKALGRRLDSVPVPLSRVQGMSDEVRQRKLPTHYPGVRALQAIGNETWVMRWSPPAAHAVTNVDVLDEEGRPLRAILLPAACETTPALAAANRVLTCMTVDADTGAEAIAIFRLP